VEVRKLRVIYLLSFIGDLTLSMLLVITILYGTKIGLSTIEVGLIGGSYGFAYIFMPFILGRFSDNINRKTSLMIVIFDQMILALTFLFIITQTSDFTCSTVFIYLTHYYFTQLF
jgi:MFS family permease